VVASVACMLDFSLVCPEIRGAKQGLSCLSITCELAVAVIESPFHTLIPTSSCSIDTPAPPTLFQNASMFVRELLSGRYHQKISAKFPE